MPDTPMFQNTLSYSGQNLRDALRMVTMATGATFGARGGVRPGDPGLTVSLSGSTINVSPGTAILPDHGVYIGVLTSTWSGTLTAAHATLDRIDLVYLRIWDTDFDATGLRKTDVVYLAGTASSTPAAPTPGGTEIYLPLATITVPHTGAGSPSVSTSVKPVTVAPGGVLPTSTAPSSPYTGQYYDDGTNLRRYNGSSWDTYQKTPGAWTAWTPTWSTTSGLHLPSYGNAVVDCRYSKMGRTVLYYLHIVFGTTTNFGSGVVGSDNWSFSLPFAAATSGVSIGIASMEPGHSTRATSGMAQVNTDLTTMSLFITGARIDGTASTGLVDSITPFTWGSAMRVEVSGQYEAAA